MRGSLLWTLSTALACAAILAGCSDSLALKDEIEEKVAYATTKYSVTAVSGNESYGKVNFKNASVRSEERINLVATPIPFSGALFSGWSVANGTVIIADPYGENTTAFVVGTDAAIQANFIAPSKRSWSAMASSDTGQYLYAAEIQGRVYASSNYGETWRLLRGSPTATYFDSIACNASGQYVVGVGGGLPGLFVSSDFGQTWTPRDPPLPNGRAAWDWVDAAINDAGNFIVAANYDGAIYTSADFAASWNERGAANGLPSNTVSWSSVASDASGSILSVAANSGNAYRSANGGVSWTLLRDFGVHWDDIYLSQNSEGSLFQLAHSYGNIYTTNTHTKDWYTSTSTGGWPGLDCDRTGQYIITARFGYEILISNNWGNGNYISYSGAGVGLPAPGTTFAYWSDVCMDGTGARMAACTSDSGNIYVSSNQGVSWSKCL